MRTGLKIVILIICILYGRQTSEAVAWWSVNIDVATTAEVAAFHAATIALESQMRSDAQKVYEFYRKGGVASTAIFMAKYMDRRALTTLGLWSSEENYYYKAIRNKLLYQIFPRIYEISKQLLKHPKDALVWVQYIGRVCQDVHGLCSQFESVVTNSELSFKDLSFPQLKAEIKDRLDAAGLSDGCLLELIKNLPSIKELQKNVKTKFSKEQLRQLCENIAKQLVDYIVSLDQSSQGSFVGALGLDPEMLRSRPQLLDVFGSILDQAQQIGFGNYLQGLAKAGKDMDPSNLFDQVAFSMSDWLTDWSVDPDSSTCYTQRWQIVRKSSGENKVLASFTPKAFQSCGKSQNERNSEGWFFSSGQPSAPSSAEAQAKGFMEARIDPWSDEKVAAENAAAAGQYQIIKETTHRTQEVFQDSQTGQEVFNPSAPNIRYAGVWHAYAAIVRQDANKGETILVDTVFDSATMNLQAFSAELTAIRSAYEDEDISIHNGQRTAEYFIRSFDKKSYTQETAETLRGCESVTIYVNCHDVAELASGSTHWRCWHSHEDKLNEQAKSCAKNSLSSQEAGESLEYLEEELSEIRRQKEDIKARLEEIPAEKEAAIAAGDTDKLESLIGEEKSKQTIYIGLIEAETGLQSEIEETKNETLSDVSWASSGRIDDLMEHLAATFSLKWDGPGEWNNTAKTFVATAHSISSLGAMSSVKYTFTAQWRCDKKRQKCVFFWIHRNRMSLHYTLTSEGTTKKIFDVLIRDGDPFDQSKDDEYAKLVEQRKSEARAENPGCEIEVERIIASADSLPELNKTYHLVWSSDRLEIARECLGRLTSIQGDLIAIQRLVDLNQNWLTVVRNMLPITLDYRMREASAAQEAMATWKQSARNYKQANNSNYSPSSTVTGRDTNSPNVSKKSKQ